jgi:hypothetical protein
MLEATHNPVMYDDRTQRATFMMMDGPRYISVHVTHDAVLALGLHSTDDLKDFFVRKRNYLESIARAKYKRGGEDVEITRNDVTWHKLHSRIR